MLLFAGNVLRRTPVLFPECKNQPEKNRFRDDKPESNQCGNQQKQVVNALRIGGCLDDISLPHNNDSDPDYRIKPTTAMTNPPTKSTMTQKTFEAIWSGDEVVFSTSCSSPEDNF